VNRPRLLSLCTGYGGLDHAAEEVFDAELVAVSDIDPGANKILTHRYPHTPNLGDLKRIDWDAWAGVEIVTAGYPCQPFSHAGKRAGTDDPRHIFPNIAEGIRRVGPRLVLLENVRGHLRLGFDTVLGVLSDIGYDTRWVCIRASDVGACHNRERLFIAATPRNADGSDFSGWTTTTGQQGEARPTARREVPDGLALLRTPTAQLAVNEGSQHPDKRKAGGHGPTLADEVEHLLPTPRATDGTKGGPNQRGSSGDLMLPSAVLHLGTLCPTCGCDDGLHDSDGFCAGPCGGNDFDCGGRDLVLLPTPAVNDMGRGKTVEAWDEWTARMKTAHGNGNGHGPSLEIEAMRLLPTPTAAVTEPKPGIKLSGRKPSDPQVGLVDVLLGSTFGKYAAAIARQEAAFGHPAPPPTEPTGKGGAHRLSPRFVEWMMGCHPGWVTDVPGLSRNDQLKALGNGVVRQQAAAAIRYITADAETAVAS
jgi:DNA (cytosine-5)-methyltransferase 1